MNTYEIRKNEIGESLVYIDKNGTEFFIPKDPANSDYQRYLAWLENPEAEQSTPSVMENLTEDQ
jgi:hypothetical protein